MSAEVPHELSRCFYGLARVDVGRVHHNTLPVSSYFARRTPAERRQAHALACKFELEGCRRLDAHNFIDVLVLDNVAGAHDRPLPSTPPPCADDIPFLQARVDCLHGLHRLLAACEFIEDAADRWWTARVFTQELLCADRTRIAEQFGNESSRLDGVVFRNIRLYHRAGDVEGEKRWWARLTETKRKDLRQMLRDLRFVQVFDAMLEWRGLWPPVKLGCLHRLLTMKCDEEILNYLNHVVEVWNHILRGVRDKADIVDEQTVSHLETLVPGVSTEDRLQVRGMMEQRKIFPGLQSAQDRDVVLQNILDSTVMIPSLRTFFESLKHLEPCAKIMRDIADIKGHSSVRAALWASYSRPTDTFVEYSEGDIRTHNEVSPHVGKILSYQQLWLYAMRHFREMVNTTARKDKAGEKPVAVEPDPLLWQMFGDFCWRLGFQTLAARRLRESDGVGMLARRISVQIGADENSSIVDTLTQIIRQYRSKPACAPSFSFSNIECLPKERRCGRPFARDYAIDSLSLFLPNLFTAQPDQHVNYVSTFFCHKEIFVGFFGLESAGVRFTAQAVPSDDGDGDPSFVGNDRSSPCPSCHVTKRTLVDAVAREAHLQGDIDGLRCELAALREALEQAQSVNPDHNTPTDTAVFLQEKLVFLQQEFDKMREDLREARQEAFQLNSTSVIEREQFARQLQERNKQIEDLQKELDFKSIIICGLEARLQKDSTHPPRFSTIESQQEELHARSSSVYSTPDPGRSNQSLGQLRLGASQRIDLLQLSEINNAEAAGDLIFVQSDLEREAYRVSARQAGTIVQQLTRDPEYRFYVAHYRTLPRGFKIVSKSDHSHSAKDGHLLEVWKAAGALAVQRSQDTTRVAEERILQGADGWHGSLWRPRKRKRDAWDVVDEIPRCYKNHRRSGSV